MAIEQIVRAQLDKLISDGQALAPGQGSAGQVRDEDHRSECIAWLVAAEHLVTLVCKSPTDVYRRQVSGIVASHPKAGWVVNELVGQVTGILRRLSGDVDQGLIASITIAASAETLDDLLDQATEYHKRGSKEGAAILATAIFEDTLRRLARTNGISEAGAKADQIISDLDKKDVITGVMAKRCRVVAGVRNHGIMAQTHQVAKSMV